MRDMNDIVVVADLDLLKLADAGPDTQFAVKPFCRWIGIDTLGLPAVGRKSSNRFAEAARNIEKPASLLSRQRRKEAIRALATGFGDCAAIGPGCGLLTL